MDLSVLIPTYRRPEALRTCLMQLAAQHSVFDFEIVLGIDGDLDATPEPEIPVNLQEHVRIIRPGRVGLLKLRRLMLVDAKGQYVLWMNDDAYPHAGLLDAHFRSHKEGIGPRVVAGRAIWKPIEQTNMFDRIVQQSDMVFFTQPERRSAVDYRNCFGLNMSFPRALAMKIGGVADVDEHYGYEDIELAWRMVRAGASCIYEPEAVVTHDHRYTPTDVHRREYLLGRAAYAFAHANPDFAMELFKSDLRECTTLDQFSASISLAWRDSVRVERTFLELTQCPVDAVSDGMLPIFTEHWVLLKRLLWRWGVLDASRGIVSRWSILSQTSPDQVLNPPLIPV